MSLRVIVASPVWSLNGVNIFSANLVRGLRQRGISAEILLTNVVQDDPKPMVVPTDIPVCELPVGQRDSYPIRWREMQRYLESRSPGIYLPNYDFAHSCVSPKLANEIAVVGIVHSDDAEHYDHVSRLGTYWNSVVAVSKVIAAKVASRYRNVAERVVTIPHGVPILECFPERSFETNSPLRIVYHGALKQFQKRVLDLPKIVQALRDRQVPVELTIAGGGPTLDRLREDSRRLIEDGAIRFMGIVPYEKVPELLLKNDIYLLTSEFEGMPNALLEAMGHGCVPVVTDIESGIPELVDDGRTGYRIQVGNIEMFAGCLAKLHHDVGLRRQMSRNAYSVVDKGEYRIRNMVDRYIDLFHRVLGDLSRGVYRRPYGRIRPPPSLQPRWRRYMRQGVRQTARYGKGMLSRLADW